MHINSFGQTITDEQEKQVLEAEIKFKVEEIHRLLAENTRLESDRDLWRWRFEELKDLLEKNARPGEISLPPSALLHAALEIMAATKGDG